ncbi:MAG: VWA domain-containing protein [Chloroflexota bacterium]
MEDVPDFGQTDPSPQAVFDTQDAYWWEGGKKTEAGDEFKPAQIQSDQDRVTRKQSGRRSRTQTDRKRGRYIRSAPAGRNPTDIAFDATLRAAAPFQKSRQDQKDETGMAYAIRKTDLRKKVRVRRAGNLVLFAVDASWSMAVSERMQATKGAILSLLTDAYQRRDRVGLIVFHRDRAYLVLPPTNSVTLAKEALSDIPVGGKTPLSAGLWLSYETVQRERALDKDVMPLIVLLTDGAGNVSMYDEPPQDEAMKIADTIRDSDIKTITINMEHKAFDQGLADQLAERLGGPCHTLDELHAEALLQTVRNELEML